MKRKTIMKVIAMLLFLTLAVTAVWAGGKKPVTAAEKKVAPGVPQYGGTLTVLNARVSSADPGSPWIMDNNWPGLLYLTPVLEGPLVGDFLKRGPRGTGEFTFQMGNYVPAEFLAGQLLESWEVSTEKLVWHVRPGIYWAANNVDWMENRELTADDVVADLLEYRECPGGKAFKGYSGDIYATDKYTVVIEFANFDVSWAFYLGYEDRALISPPEMIAAGADKWKNQVGTGPFMFKEYAVGSNMTFERNPNWWQKTTIKGVEYQGPFIDEMIWPIIPDVATQIAALQTGKIDYYWQVPAEQWDHLDKVAPELLNAKFPAAFGRSLLLVADEPPFSSREARRAMMIGTDLKAFQDLYGRGQLPLHHWPVSSSHNESTYTPIEKLPAEARTLYDYNPELASKMLRKAGVPEGFKMEYLVDSGAYNLDEAALLEDQWKKIGIDLQIKAVDYATYSKIAYAFTATHSLRNFGGSILNPFDFFPSNLYTGRYGNFGSWSNAEFDALTDKLTGSPDVDEQNRLIKEAAIVALEDVPAIPLNLTLDGDYWWPWVKNYYGEHIVRDNDFASILAHAWIDQDLKKKMGY